MQMHQLDARLRRMLQTLQGLRVRVARPVENITIAHRDSQDFVPFVNGSEWGTDRDHDWMDFKFTVVTPEDYRGKVTVSIVTGREGMWEATNPQFVVWVNGRIEQSFDTRHTSLTLENEAVPGKKYEIFLQGYAKSNLIDKLNALLTSTVARVTHAEAIEILRSAPKQFEHEAVQGQDIFKEHEKYLTEEYFKSPVFVYDWPKDIKAFYMYQNDDGKTVAAVDLLVPGSGELMGGSQRETRLDLLVGRMNELGISTSQMDWYVNLRRYGGCTHSGFGMGFERLVMYLTDIENIRDVIPYPRTPGNCDF